jgi:hypothetical protein
MKRLMLVIAVVLASAVYTNASAQHITKKRVGTYKENGVVVMSDATTTFMAKFVVEYDEFKAGPYARYAQTLLGSRAFVVDSSKHSIVAADVALLEGDEYGFTENLDKYQNYSISEPTILADRMSTLEKNLETAAREAAETIFKLRKARMELITGEQGEGFFGGGLEGALKEITRLENEYLELFYGRRVVRYETYSYILPVDAENSTMTIARFSANDGIVAIDDLAGEVIFLNIKPSQMEYPANEEKGSVAIRYANNAEVSLCLGSNVLCSRVMPVYEFGETVMITKPR